jgi:hypothetical protein
MHRVCVYGATPIGRKLMKLGKLAEQSDNMSIVKNLTLIALIVLVLLVVHIEESVLIHLTALK